MTQDIRFGARLLGRRPGFTLAAVASLALGVGLNIAIFTLVCSLLLEPLPARDPDRLVTVYTSDFSGPAFGGSSYPDFQDFRAQNDALADLAALNITTANFTMDARTERTFGEIVSPNYFTLLGVTPQLGRTFTEPPAGAAAPDQTPVAVLGYRFWQRRFNGDPTVVGRSVSFNGQSFTVIGVAPAAFPGMIRGLASDFWIPSYTNNLLNPGSNDLTSRGSRGALLVGRLAPGRTVADAQGRFDVIAERLQQAYHDNWTDRLGHRRRISVMSEFESRLPAPIRPQVAAFLLLLFGLVFLVLLVACANVAGLLLARAVARQREMAIRLSLGASRTRLVRQLLIEALMLSTIAGAAGLLVGQWAVALVLSFKPPVAIPLYLDVAINWRIALFAVTLSILTAIIFGLAPAMQAARPDVVSALKGHAARMGRRRVPLRQSLVAFQVACSLTLLIVAGLFVRGLQQTQRLDLGFDPTHVAQVTLSLGAREEAAGQQRYAEILERVQHAPGVQAATLSTSQPLGMGSRRAVNPSNYTHAQGEDREVLFNVVSPRYFETLRIPLARGRDFSPSDRDGAPRVVMVNEAFAARYWPGLDPLEQRIAMGGNAPEHQLTVVGIARNAAFGGLQQVDRPMFFLPIAQHYENEAILFVRTLAEPGQMLPTLRRELAGVDASVLLFDEKTLADAIGIVLVPNRIAATLLGAAGLLGLLLAGVGLFGVLAQIVGERTREIGIRLALGAEQPGVLRMIVLQGMRLTAIGMAIGLAAALGLGRLAASWLYGVSPADPLTFIVTPLALLGVAVAASYLPARRAARVNPIDALRQE